MTAATDVFIPIDARVGHNGLVDVMIDGAPVPGGSGLAMPAVLTLLTRYARVKGAVLMTTIHPDGGVTRDVITPEGDVAPFYPPAVAEPDAETAGPGAEANQDELLRALARHSDRKVLARDVAAAPVTAVAPATVRVHLGSGSIPEYNVESDVQKDLAARRPPMSPAKRLGISLAVTVLALGAVAAAGWAAISGGLVG